MLCFTRDKTKFRTFDLERNCLFSLEFLLGNLTWSSQIHIKLTGKRLGEKTNEKLYVAINSPCTVFQCEDVINDSLVCM